MIKLQDWWNLTCTKCIKRLETLEKEVKLLVYNKVYSSQRLRDITTEISRIKMKYCKHK